MKAKKMKVKGKKEKKVKGEKIKEEKMIEEQSEESKSKIYQIPIKLYEEEMRPDKKDEIIDLLTNSNHLHSVFDFYDIQEELHVLCRKGKVELIKLYLSETLSNYSRTYVFKVDKKNKTASLFRANHYDKEIIVPRTIQLESKDYLITSVCGTNKISKTLYFPENSAVEIFYENAIPYGSNIEEIYIPPSLKELKDGWCYRPAKLRKFIISPLNDHFQLKDNRYLIGKSVKNGSEFDTILCAFHDIEEISIPPNIKIISPKAFDQCRLKKVEIPKNSNLEIIGSFAFSNTKIDSIYIPSKVTKICEYAFDNCYDLIKVKIPKNSNLQTIESSAFDSNIKKIYFPASLKELKEYWCSNLSCLTKIKVSRSNNHFKCKKGKYLVGKSDENKNKFDVLLFVCRDIREFSISSKIKIISSSAFSCCHNLTRVTFRPNSNLQIIKYDAFADTNIESIYIPPKVTRISYYAFSGCRYLKKVEIPANSNLQIIDSNAFKFSNIESFCLPSKVKTIGIYSFYGCKNFKIIEILEESELESLSSLVFKECSHCRIMIPLSLQKLINE